MKNIMKRDIFFFNIKNEECKLHINNKLSYNNKKVNIISTATILKKN